ncbi:DNA segregation ATPase, FtsK/SpoIIIE family [Mycobacteroides abscessus subsp. abscessus]|nr:DNA segregation ATPase, FtsK/SpoIIIE family [Mycobacteroides abscessus subsp. abscessus]
MKFIEQYKLKAKLKQCFRRAELCYKSNMGDRVVYAYPRIHSMKTNDSFTEIVFSLLVGLDPSIMKKKAYVFAQQFGKGIEMEGDLKNFTLVIYKKEFKEQYNYDYKEIYPHVEKLKLGVIAGKNRHNEYVAFDLTKQPHILIAGETGSGKSTQIRSVITTMVLTKKPSELIFYLADCKKSEFHIFRKLEHVQCVESQPKKIEAMLKKIKKELDERSDLTEMFEVAHADDLPPEHKRPYIVLCIDEFVMLRDNEKIMETLIEVVAIGRTLGIFAILSMQRPSAKILDTTVRANLTVSMGFKLRDRIEATIVNTPGAQDLDLTGHFIMNSDQLHELQAPYLDLEKAKELLSPFYVMKNPTKDITPKHTPKQEENPDLKYIDLFDNKD